LRAIDARTEPDVKRAVPGVVVAVIGFSVGARLGGIDRRTPARFGVFDVAVEVSAGWVTLVVLALMAVFVLAGLMATRSLGRELARVVSVRGNVEAGNAIRLLCFIAGYAIVGFGVLTLLHVNLGNLLVGGAITGVVVGIAAQQTLGNFFAGLVLLFARPYVPGHRVKISSGAMGGPFEGVITGSGLMYTTIDTPDGLVSMPNAGLLAAAIGPAPEPTAREATAPGPTAGH